VDADELCVKADLMHVAAAQHMRGRDGPKARMLLLIKSISS